MMTFETMLAGHDGTGHRSSYDRWNRAQTLFDERRYRDAALELSALLEAEDGREQSSGLGHVELLLARSYYHSAQLGRAETAARALIARDPDDGYAHRLLERTLQRAGRRDEAAQHGRIADALGVE